MEVTSACQLLSALITVIPTACARADAAGLVLSLGAMLGAANTAQPEAAAQLLAAVCGRSRNNPYTTVFCGWRRLAVAMALLPRAESEHTSDVPRMPFASRVQPGDGASPGGGGGGGRRLLRTERRAALHRRNHQIIPCACFATELSVHSRFFP